MGAICYNLELESSEVNQPFESNKVKYKLLNHHCKWVENKFAHVFALQAQKKLLLKMEAKSQKVMKGWKDA